MNSDSMVDMLDTARTELVKVERQIAELSRHADALRQIVTGVQTYLEMATQTEPDSVVLSAGGTVVGQVKHHPVVGPRGRDAVRAILMEQPGEAMTAAAIAEKIDGRGWIESGNALDATRTNLLRAMKKWPENVVRVGQGVYMWQPTLENSEGPASAGPSVVSNQSAAATAGAQAEGGDGSDDDSVGPAHHPASVAG